MPTQITTPNDNPQLLAALQTYFGFSDFRTGQKAVIQAALDKRDVLTIKPTGGGKSLCYQLPALLGKGLTVVVSPLIALMQDQVDALCADGIAAACLHGHINPEQRRHIFKALYEDRLRLLYIAPERLLHASFLEWLATLNICLFAIDEAHCISQWGHDFRPEYARLGQLKQHFADVPIMALTATADEATRQDIIQQLQLREPFIQVASFDRPNIRYMLIERNHPANQVLRYIRTKPKQSGIIYCRSRDRTQRLAMYLQQRDILARPYHAGLDASERRATQRAFICDDIDIVVATVAFGMGINKPNVRFVIHADLPKSIEAYYQETGRAGRDGEPSEAILLYDPADIKKYQHFLQEKADNAHIEQHKLSTMAAFAQAQTCRRQVLLHYFGQNQEHACGNCDICLNPPETFDGTEIARKALSCVYRVEQRFGVQYVVDILKGSNAARIKQFGHDKLSTYGIGKEYSSAFWRSVLYQLIHKGFLAQVMTDYMTLRLTPTARPVLRGEASVELAKPRDQQPSQQKNKNDLPLDTHEQELFEKLRALRKELAQTEKLPPYIVASDAVLSRLAQQQPMTLIELRQINGIGERKAKRFGDAFLDLLRKHSLQSSLP